MLNILSAAWLHLDVKVVLQENIVKIVSVGKRLLTN